MFPVARKAADFRKLANWLPPRAGLLVLPDCGRRFVPSNRHRGNILVRSRLLAFVYGKSRRFPAHGIYLLVHRTGRSPPECTERLLGLFPGSDQNDVLNERGKKRKNPLQLVIDCRSFSSSFRSPVQTSCASASRGRFGISLGSELIRRRIEDLLMVAHAEIAGPSFVVRGQRWTHSHAAYSADQLTDGLLDGPGELSVGRRI